MFKFYRRLATLFLSLTFYFRDKVYAQALKDLTKVEKKVAELDQARIDLENQGDRLRDFIERNKA